jgi:phosphatidylserine/phosphatidylglycerophosphate/cardiolipin synthase-like enzyme
MTFNLQSKYYPTSRDFGLVDGDATDVTAIEKTFEGDWNGSKVTATSGRDLLWSPGSAPTLLALIDSASTSLDIYTLEMADDRITAALKRAAARGVMVRVNMTYATNWKPALNELTLAGVRIRTFASSAKLFIHAKVIIADDIRMFIGSENFSQQSLDLNRELGILTSRPDLIDSVMNTFEKDWVGSRPFRATSKK